MPSCVRAVQGADGTVFLALDHTNTNLSTCQYIVEDGTGQGWNQLAYLSIEDGNTIGLAILSAWAVAYGFRLLAQAININTHEEN